VSVVAHTDQMIAHWHDPSVPPDCGCEFCRIGQAIDGAEEVIRARVGLMRVLAQTRRPNVISRDGRSQ
jgi:hypothetical protein